MNIVIKLNYNLEKLHMKDLINRLDIFFGIISLMAMTDLEEEIKLILILPSNYGTAIGVLYIHIFIVITLHIKLIIYCI